jgi:hypothetical protein
MNRKPDSVMGRVRTLLTEDTKLTIAQLFDRLKEEFPKDNPRWLRNQIRLDRHYFLKRLKCSHADQALPYMAAAMDAERRMAKGERQLKCPNCLRWFWESEFK